MRNGFSQYNAADLEVLKGLEPVKRRPGMYTDTTRPNHLAHEVIDNAVDEAIAGFADRIEVVHFKDGSLEVTDNGRGMPVDKHPEENVSGVEVIMTRLHAGPNSTPRTTSFRAASRGRRVRGECLSSKLDVEIRRNGLVHRMSFKDGKKPELKTIGKAPKSATGTKVRFGRMPSISKPRNFPQPSAAHAARQSGIVPEAHRHVFR
jgi:topoisomerase-4 subunit B